MADLKTSATSDYPTTLDTFTAIVDADTRSAAPMNGIADAFIKAETALGTSPQGTKQDVKTYLQIGHTTAGVHRQGFADTYTGLVSNTTSETSLATVDVAANTLKTSENIRVTAGMAVTYLGAADTVTFIARYGDNSTMASATSCFNSGALTLTANTWTERSNPKNFALNGITYGNGLYVAVGSADGTDAYIVTSTDGTTWTERANPKNVALLGITYGNGLYVAVGDADGTDAYIVTSTDATTWTEQSNSKNFSLFGIAYGNGLYVAVGNPDGTDAYLITWTVEYFFLLLLDLYCRGSIATQAVSTQLDFGVAAQYGVSEALNVNSVMGRHYSLTEDGTLTRRLWITATPSDASDITVSLQRLNAELWGV